MECRNCGRQVGAEVKVQPTNVDGEVFCPRCFVGVRMHREPERYNASQSGAVTCQFCKFESVTQGAIPGGSLRCGHCGRFGCLLVPIKDMPFDQETLKAAEAAIHEAQRAK